MNFVLFVLILFLPNGQSMSHTHRAPENALKGIWGTNGTSIILAGNPNGGPKPLP